MSGNSQFSTKAEGARRKLVNVNTQGLIHRAEEAGISRDSVFASDTNELLF